MMVSHKRLTGLARCHEPRSTALKLIQVVPAITNEASGPSYSVRRLCDSLISLGVDVRLAALDWEPSANSPAYQRTFPLGIGPRRLGFSPHMRSWLETEAHTEQADLMHSHSLWMMPNVYPAAAVRGTKCKLIMSPRGALSVWALNHNRFRKRLFWRLFQERATQAADLFHATARSEYEDIRRVGLRQPVCVLPNGVDIPPLIGVVRKRRVLFLGRIHPKKGVDVLLRAWEAIQGRYDDWELQIVGPEGDAHSAAMRTLSSQLGLRRVSFAGPLFGAQKNRAYQEASVFVLPTNSENFGMTVAESLAAATPVIVTKGAPWQELREKGAGWWIDPGVDSLVACLGDALERSSSELRLMGDAGRQWMENEFSWCQISDRFLTTYKWLLHGGDRPSWVLDS